MPQEIERKFLVVGDDWRAAARRATPMRQGYLVGGEKGSVRVRLAGPRAWLNIKSATLGATRLEFDYPIPPEDAREMLEGLCEGPQIEKTRHEVPAGTHVWEVDEFHGANAGLVVAEIELDHLDEPFQRPPWLGREVTDDHRYYNTSLARHPWTEWK